MAIERDFGVSACVVKLEETILEVLGIKLLDQSKSGKKEVRFGNVRIEYDLGKKWQPVLAICSDLGRSRLSVPFRRSYCLRVKCLILMALQKPHKWDLRQCLLDFDLDEA
jgi:hypothetical protein